MLALSAFALANCLANVCLAFALIAILASEALPVPSSIYFRDEPLPPLDDSELARRAVFDPYGFNSVLSRFVDPRSAYNMYRKRLVRFADDDLSDSFEDA